MKTITLIRKSTKRIEGTNNFRLDLEVTASQNISKDVFIKQRITKFNGTTDDIFVAVASPTNLEEIDVRSPASGSSYFRTNAISLVSSDPTFLEDAFNNILGEIQLLCDQANILEEMEVDGVYTITSTDITANMATIHTHYRLPLRAAPAGVNNVYIDEESGVKKHEILDVDTNLPGWLPTGVSDPAGYKFKYNLAEDSSLAQVWPVKAEYLQYAHIEKNGAAVPDLLINAEGIFWKSDLFGEVPWPKSYESEAVPWVDPKDAVTLVFDTLA